MKDIMAILGNLENAVRDDLLELAARGIAEPVQPV
ncbi:MAG: hypothetical protein JWR69_3416 [Pedosphaera sp.]|nr:hypothetical protein [Pedosphaera sp.]